MLHQADSPLYRVPVCFFWYYLSPMSAGGSIMMATGFLSTFLTNTLLVWLLTLASSWPVLMVPQLLPYHTDGADCALENFQILWISLIPMPASMSWHNMTSEVYILWTSWLSSFLACNVNCEIVYTQVSAFLNHNQSIGTALSIEISSGDIIEENTMHLSSVSSAKLSLNNKWRIYLFIFAKISKSMFMLSFCIIVYRSMDK